MFAEGSKRDAPFHDHEWAVEVVGCELVMLQSTFSHQGHCGNAAKVLAIAKVDLKQPRASVEAAVVTLAVAVEV